MGNSEYEDFNFLGAQRSLTLFSIETVLREVLRSNRITRDL